jgi:SHS2 domain-containing protein
MSIPYERIAHTADVAIRVYGRDVPELFVHAARALFDMMAEPPATTGITRGITVDGVDAEDLLVNWLNALVFLNEVERETYSDFALDSFTPTLLTATLTGGPTVRRIKGIKAATYHDLEIRETPAGVEADVVFDV